MTVLSLIAATLTFTATSTGVEKGVPMEFVFVGKGSDRDYESLFVLDDSVGDLCRRMEDAGFPRGKPENLSSCTLWPVGCVLTLTPSLDIYLDSKLPEGFSPAPAIYTGGLRLPDGSCDAVTNMPMAAFSLYSLSQSPIVFNGRYEQGVVYNCHLAKKKIEKGTRLTFTLSCDTNSFPRPLSLTAEPGKSAELIKALRDASAQGEVDARIDFAPELTVSEAQSVAQALSVIDSRSVKINGYKPGHLYFRAFLPLVKWLDRRERLVQPFELTIGSTTNALVHVDEDWTVEGNDPKLTARTIGFNEAVRYPTDTCFIFAGSNTRLSTVYKAMSDLKGSKVRTWYVFVRD